MKLYFIVYFSKVIDLVLLFTVNTHCFFNMQFCIEVTSIVPSTECIAGYIPATCKKLPFSKFLYPQRRV